MSPGQRAPRVRPAAGWRPRRVVSSFAASVARAPTRSRPRARAPARRSRASTIVDGAPPARVAAVDDEHAIVGRSRRGRADTLRRRLAAAIRARRGDRPAPRRTPARAPPDDRARESRRSGGPHERPAPRTPARRRSATTARARTRSASRRAPALSPHHASTCARDAAIRGSAADGLAALQREQRLRLRVSDVGSTASP